MAKHPVEAAHFIYVMLRNLIIEQRNYKIQNSLELSILIIYRQLLVILISQLSKISLNATTVMSQRGNSHSKQVARMDMHDPFTNMHQLMRGFGGFGSDPFFGEMMGFRGDPFQDIFKFSDVHKNMHSKGSTGSYVCQSYVSSSKMGPDGKVVRQNYFQNSMGEHKNGNTISQKQQAYKNSSGVNRIAEERMLNDKGRKIVREKNGNNYEQTNHYYNIDEEEAGHFDSNWRQADQNMKFLENHKKYVQQIQNEPRHRQIAYEPQYHQPVRQERRKNEVEPQRRSQKPDVHSIAPQSRGSKRSSGTTNSRKC